MEIIICLMLICMCININNYFGKADNNTHEGYSKDCCNDNKYAEENYDYEYIEYNGNHILQNQSL